MLTLEFWVNVKQYWQQQLSIFCFCYRSVPTESPDSSHADLNPPIAKDRIATSSSGPSCPYVSENLEDDGKVGASQVTGLFMPYGLH